MPDQRLTGKLLIKQFLVKVYDFDEVKKFQNEVAKLDLLSQILTEVGIEKQDFLV